MSQELDDANPELLQIAAKPKKLPKEAQPVLKELIPNRRR